MTTHHVFRTLYEDSEAGIVENTPSTLLFFRLSSSGDCDRLEELMRSEPHIVVRDQIRRQLGELVKNRFADRSLNEEETQEAIRKILGGRNEQEYGVWVYYPWLRQLVHLLDEEEFIELRTCRNLFKITRAERDLLSTRKIAIIGLSVGQTIAIALAMERICGELRIADFDTLDLGNLNRLRAGVHELGLSKTALAERSILEIDPFIRIKCFPEGVHFDNMDRFLTEGGNVDILVEESDSIDMKVFSRIAAKSHRIPVIMDTNDRGMLDVERYDLDPELPLLHGFISGLDPTKLRNLTR
ncbi:MAG TPA: ThiF family adenylyltransferase, partial [Chitinophagaceae bacterium]|nr:ThiF family adenylyltransferase [Chitinophagaceae bacterium]